MNGIKIRIKASIIKTFNVIKLQLQQRIFKDGKISFFSQIKAPSEHIIVAQYSDNIEFEFTKNKNETAIISEIIILYLLFILYYCKNSLYIYVINLIIKLCIKLPSNFSRIFLFLESFFISSFIQKNLQKNFNKTLLIFIT